MFATCPNCAKRIKSAGGWAFHSAWCKPAAPVAERGAPGLTPSVYRLRAWRSWTEHDAGQVDVDTVYATRDEAMAVREELPHPIIDVVAEPKPVTVAEHAAAFVAEHPMHDLEVVADTIRTADATIAEQDTKRAELAAAYGAETLYRLALATIAEQAPEPEPDPTPTPTHKARKAPATRKAGADPMQVGPVRVLALTAEEVAYVEKHPTHAYGGYSQLIGDTLRAKYTRCPHPSARIGNTPDPLATAAAPMLGYRAPVTYIGNTRCPVIAYVAERDAGDKRPGAPSSSYPRLEAMHASAKERKATRRTHSRPAWRSVADPLATAQRPPVAGQIAGIGRPVGHALAVPLRERTGILARVSFADGGTRDLAA